jgi:hypothetical protein
VATYAGRQSNVGMTAARQASDRLTAALISSARSWFTPRIAPTPAAGCGSASTQPNGLRLRSCAEVAPCSNHAAKQPKRSHPPGVYGRRRTTAACPDGRSRIIKKARRRPRNQLPRSNRLARYGHRRLLTRLTPLHQLMLHQLILCSAAFFPPIAFDCLALPPTCCIEEHSHRDVKDGEAELCSRHDVAFPT